MNITTATPAEIDAEIARIGSLINGQYTIVDKAEKVLASEHATETRRAAARESIEACIVALNGLRAEEAPYVSEFNARGGWTRYYLVEGGHLHYDVSAHRCSRIQSTSHYWLTEQSGKSADEVIELAGDRVCTNCFPDAPVAVQERPSQLLTKSEQEKAQDRVERAQKAAEKAAKAKANEILDPETGEALTVKEFGRTETFKTERAASIELVNLMWYQRFYGDDAERRVAIGQILKAIAVKHDTNCDEVYAGAEKKLAARIKREG